MQLSFSEIGKQDAQCWVTATRFAVRKGLTTMFLALFFILLVLWVLGFAAFHIAGGLIHLLLILAVISIILHFVRGRSAV